MTLAVLAAGFGSRFGGPKQFTPVGPHGQLILHLTAHQALSAGFDHLLVLTRPELLPLAEQTVPPHLPPGMAYTFALQPHPDRKPLGTAHALLSCGPHLETSPTPFALANADDVYGPESWTLAAQLAQNLDPKSRTLAAAVPFRLGQTLSPHGGVSRAVCQTQPGPDHQTLLNIQETTQIQRLPSGQITGLQSISHVKTQIDLPEETPVSLNLFLFHPAIFSLLQAHTESHFANNPDAEAGLPQFLNAAIQTQTLRAIAKTSPARWLGLTYPEDLTQIQTALATQWPPNP